MIFFFPHYLILPFFVALYVIFIVETIALDHYSKNRYFVLWQGVILISVGLVFVTVLPLIFCILTGGALADPVPTILRSIGLLIAPAGVFSMYARRLVHQFKFIFLEK